VLVQEVEQRLVDMTCGDGFRCNGDMYEDACKAEVWNEDYALLRKLLLARALANGVCSNPQHLGSVHWQYGCCATTCVSQWYSSCGRATITGGYGTYGRSIPL
jgi:hypothetical protein